MMDQDVDRHEDTTTEVMAVAVMDATTDMEVETTIVVDTEVIATDMVHPVTTIEAPAGTKNDQDMTIDQGIAIDRRETIGITTVLHEMIVREMTDREMIDPVTDLVKSA